MRGHRFSYSSIVLFARIFLWRGHIHHSLFSTERTTAPSIIPFAGRRRVNLVNQNDSGKSSRQDWFAPKLNHPSFGCFKIGGARKTGCQQYLGNLPSVAHNGDDMTIAENQILCAREAFATAPLPMLALPPVSNILKAACDPAGMAELADALDLGSNAARHGGSSPPSRTIFIVVWKPKFGSAATMA